MSAAGSACGVVAFRPELSGVVQLVAFGPPTLLLRPHVLSELTTEMTPIVWSAFMESMPFTLPVVAERKKTQLYDDTYDLVL